MLLSRDVLLKVLANKEYVCSFGSASDFSVTVLDSKKDGKTSEMVSEVRCRVPNSDSVGLYMVMGDSSYLGGYEFSRYLTEVKLLYASNPKESMEIKLDSPLDANFFSHFHKESAFLIRLYDNGFLVDGFNFTYNEAKEYLDVARRHLKVTSKFVPKSMVIGCDWYVVAGRCVVIDLFLKPIE